jgi:hypothetical protein
MLSPSEASTVTSHSATAPHAEWMSLRDGVEGEGMRRFGCFQS